MRIAGWAQDLVKRRRVAFRIWIDWYGPTIRRWLIVSAIAGVALTLALTVIYEANVNMRDRADGEPISSYANTFTVKNAGGPSFTKGSVDRVDVGVAKFGENWQVMVNIVVRQPNSEYSRTPRKLAIEVPTLENACYALTPKDGVTIGKWWTSQVPPDLKEDQADPWKVARELGTNQIALTGPCVRGSDRHEVVLDGAEVWDDAASQTFTNRFGLVITLPNTRGQHSTIKDSDLFTRRFATSLVLDPTAFPGADRRRDAGDFIYCSCVSGKTFSQPALYSGEDREIHSDPTMGHMDSWVEPAPQPILSFLQDNAGALIAPPAMHAVMSEMFRRGLKKVGAPGGRRDQHPKAA